MAAYNGNDGGTGQESLLGPGAPGYTPVAWTINDWPGYQGFETPSTGGAPAPTTGLLWPRTRT